MADRLREEFGHLPEVYGNYLAVAQNTNCDHSRDMARRILQMPAPASVKAAAQRVLDRANLMRRPLDFALTTVQGKSTTLAALAGSGQGARTVVVFRAGDLSAAGPPGLHTFAKNAPSNTKWIYVSIGAWAPVRVAQGAPPTAANPAVRDRNGKGDPPAIKGSAAPPGTYCVGPAGLGSSLVTQLKISSLPFVCVLDDKKNLNAFGRVDEIPALLNGIDRLIEP